MEKRAKGECPLLYKGDFLWLRMGGGNCLLRFLRKTWGKKSKGKKSTAEKQEGKSPLGEEEFVVPHKKPKTKKKKKKLQRGEKSSIESSDGTPRRKGSEVLDREIR